MSRYMDADALLSRLPEDLPYKASVKRVLTQAPTADAVEIKHGEWGFDGLGWTCSECGEYALTNKAKIQVHSSYCPHCGAKMDRERSENEKS